jgi:hypothetical protein
MNGAVLSVGASAGAGAIERLEILDAEGRDLIGLWQNVLVVAVRALPTKARLRRIGAVQEGVARRFPGGYAALALLPDVPHVGFVGELREEAVRLTLSTPKELRAVAEVIEGKGFLAATVRSIATGLMLVARPAWSMRVFAGIEPAAAWLSSWVDREARPSAPRRLVEAIRHTLA